MKLFVGLGNPGAKYAQNRHNIGFMALDRIAEDHGFSPWRNKFQGQFCEGKLGDSKVLLLKPTTFMNLSGQSIGEATRFHKIRLDQFTVFHDELDLAPGKMRLKQALCCATLPRWIKIGLQPCSMALAMVRCIWPQAIGLNL